MSYEGCGRLVCCLIHRVGNWHITRFHPRGPRQGCTGVPGRQKSLSCGPYGSIPKSGEQSQSGVAYVFPINYCSFHRLHLLFGMGKLIKISCVSLSTKNISVNRCHIARATLLAQRTFFWHLMRLLNGQSHFQDQRYWRYQRRSVIWFLKNNSVACSCLFNTH